MTRIDFFFNVTDKLEKAAMLSMSAVAKNRRVTHFLGSTEAAATLSGALWARQHTNFLPHCMAHEAQAHVTPVLIATDSEHLHYDDILINWHVQHPPFFSRFLRLIELVGEDENDKIAARARYKFYRARGYAVSSYDESGVALSAK